MHIYIYTYIHSYIHTTNCIHSIANLLNLNRSPMMLCSEAGQDASGIYIHIHTFTIVRVRQCSESYYCRQGRRPQHRIKPQVDPSIDGLCRGKTHTHTYIHTYTYIHTRTHMHAYIYIHTHTYTHIYTHTLNTHTHIYIYIQYR